LIESGAESIDLVFRHDTPRFEPSDWSFTDAIIENTLRVRGWPNTRVADWRIADDGAIEARLDRGDLLCADHVLFATRYRVDLAKVNYLAGEVASGNLAVSEGFPSLDEERRQ
jgi:hypothetical protein